MDTEADYYVAAGDLVNFGRGLDRCGEILARRADRVYVLPGNHETAAQIAGLCRDFGLHDFHEQHAQWGRYQVAGLGYSNPTPFNTPGEYSEAELAQKLEPFAGLAPLVLICHCPPQGTPLDQIRPGLAWRLDCRARFPAARTAGAFLLRAYPRSRRCAPAIGKTQAMNVGKQGWLLDLD